MSGIVGLYHRDGQPADARLLERMANAITHRGLDGGGQWAHGPIGLASRVFWTTPESLREQQPVSNEQACWVVWNGRLDNREELIAALTVEGIRLDGQTDPELLLACFQQWGVDCLKRLIGEFAFILWDERMRRFLCARDRLGVKPLHYAWDGQTLLISSEAKAILSVLTHTPKPDDEMVLAFLLREFREPDQARTFFQGIHRLPPAHFLLVQDGIARIQRYWAIDPARQTRYARDEEYAERFFFLFQEAVRCRLRSAFPIGCLLSGGLDSSAIVCTAARVSRGHGLDLPPFEAFISFADHPSTDERGYAQQVIQATGITAHAIPAVAQDPLAWLDEMAWFLESPIIGPGPHLGGLMNAIRARGCRVLLTGGGGDELIDETGYLADLLKRTRLARFIRETRAFAQWCGGNPRELMAMALKSVLPQPLKFWAKRILRQAPPGWINPQTAKAVCLRERLREPRLPVRCASLCQSESLLSTVGPYAVLRLEVDERHAALAGLEERYPFLDSRLVEFTLSIPSERITQHGQRKRILRMAMQGLLPEPIRLRQGKGDWTDPMDQVLGRLCRLDPPAPLQNRSGLMHRYVNFRQAEALVKRYQQGKHEARWTLWFFITLDHWLTRFWNGGERR